MKIKGESGWRYGVELFRLDKSIADTAFSDEHSRVIYVISDLGSETINIGSEKAVVAAKSIF